MRKVLVVSPHMDDAILSCGEFLAGRPDADVATVFAAYPADREQMTDYDRLSGFENAYEAVTARREEDWHALATLKASQILLPFSDSQYGHAADVDKIATMVRDWIESYDYEFVVVPLGLVHRDHIRTRRAALLALRDLDVPVWAYEELPYRVQAPEEVGSALGWIRAAGRTPQYGFIGDGPLNKKVTALKSYTSQLPLLPNKHEYLVGERFWRLERAS